jgi:hypothetical protein
LSGLLQTWGAYLSLLPKALRPVPWIREQMVQEKIEQLKKNERYDDPRSLMRFGYKVYSQNDEDGIIREIFNRIGTTNRTFVEFGVGNGLQNNTLTLLFDGWNGLWIEASQKNVAKIREGFRKTINYGLLSVINAFATKDNINELISSKVSDPEIDLLSVDIDGNDVHIFEAITCVKPRAVVIEYNSKFPPPMMFCMAYDESNVWHKDDCFGASLKYLERVFSGRGYLLVGCNIIGINAFFVREDVAQGRFLEPCTAENHYEPPRYYLQKGSYNAGHPPSYKTLEKSLILQR